MVYRAARIGGPGRWTSRSRRRAGASFILLLLIIGLGLWLAGCGGGPPAAARARATLPARWVRYRHVPGVVDLTGPRGDGRLTVAAAGRLFLLSTSGQPVPFARGSGGYTTALGPEPYIAMPAGRRVTGLGCSFGKDATYALEPNGSGCDQHRQAGQARRFASLPAVRRTGSRSTTSAASVTASWSPRRCGVARPFSARLFISQVSTIASHAPRVEGGIAVAPLSFGSFGGDLVAPDETTGQIWAIAPGGKTRLIARSPLPAGGDIGVESAAFVPAGFSRDWAAYVADRRSPGNRHPGTNSILRLPRAELTRPGIHAGELVVASEGGAQTIVIDCSATACTVRHIADGPAAAHVEGHIVFAPRR